MKKIDLGQTVGILANIGVIVGIVFLAIEIRQNNELMEADARFNRLSLSTEAYNLLSTNRELATIQVKVANKEGLTEVEAFQASMAEMRFLLNMEWMFNEMPSNSSERNYVEKQLIQNLAPDSFQLKVFEDNKNLFEAKFVSWIKINITNK